MHLTIVAADPHDPAIVQLIQTHIAYGDAAYPAESNHHLTPEEHIDADVALFAAYENDACLGMLGLKRMTAQTAEIKSMHVLEAGRGRGVGAALLEHIIALARTQGVARLYLETGSRDASAAARRLYERASFDYCAPFGSYREHPESVFMQLDL